MKQPPQDTAKLVVESLKSGEALILKVVPMTEDNRWAIKAEADIEADAE